MVGTVVIVRKKDKVFTHLELIFNGGKRHKTCVCMYVIGL